MIISDRSREIIEYLLNSNDYVTISDIAKELQVTNRTIYREMPEINRILETCCIKTDSIQGKGLQIYGSLYNIRRLQSLLEENAVEQNYSSSDRQYLILLYLIHENNFIKTQSLAIDLNTSTQTIRNDLAQLKKILENHNIELVSKKSEGIKLSGKELSKRHLLISVLIQCIPLDTFFDWMKCRHYRSNIFISLLKEWEYEDILYQSFLHINDLIEQKKINISDKEYQEFLLLLSIFVKRHHLILNQTDPLKFNFDITFVQHELYDDVKNFLQCTFDFYFIEQEEGYFNWLLNIYTGRAHFHQYSDTSLLRQLDLVTQLISRVEQAMHFPFHEDENLPENLMLHINMALERIRSGINVSNPLNNEIELSNPKLYQIVYQCLNDVYKDIDIPNDEIGYIAIYFIASIEHLRRQSISVLVVCASGMGSSKMLRSRLEREFSELKVKKIISLHKISNEILDNYDMIVSTVPLEDLDDNSYICVSPLLNNKDKEETRQYIKQFIKKGEHYE